MRVIGIYTSASWGHLQPWDEGESGEADDVQRSNTGEDLECERRTYPLSVKYNTIHPRGQQAFEMVYGKDLAALEEEWLKMLRSL